MVYVWLVVTSVLADKKVGGGGMCNSFSADLKHTNFGVVPPRGLMHRFLFYCGLHAAVKIAVPYAKHTFAVVVVRQICQKTKRTAGKLLCILNRRRKLGWR